MTCWLWHDWEKWEQYQSQTTTFGPELPREGFKWIKLRERRTCKRCGTMQDRKVRG